jgi:hypothetical protein
VQINICFNIYSKGTRPAETYDVSCVREYSTNDVLCNIVGGNMFVDLEWRRMRRKGLRIKQIRKLGSIKKAKEMCPRKRERKKNKHE